ncbi:MAG: hypothetical protein VX278_19565 [Myxococcota bacterium]|nr:hypothetical protein [Myxococcota bacterium]
MDQKNYRKKQSRAVLQHRIETSKQFFFTQVRTRNPSQSGLMDVIEEALLRDSSRLQKAGTQPVVAHFRTWMSFVEACTSEKSTRFTPLTNRMFRGWTGHLFPLLHRDMHIAFEMLKGHTIEEATERFDQWLREDPHHGLYRGGYLLKPGGELVFLGDESGGTVFFTDEQAMAYVEPEAVNEEIIVVAINSTDWH